jgi:HK97 family phage major capsid protein/HK97 family phage prohead protease
MDRAYSTIDIKAVDEERRIIEGIASTPTPDRIGDVVVPEGMDFKLPFPFLYQHNSRQPIGTVMAAKVTKEGMSVRVQIARAGVAAFIDEAWALIKEGLIRGLSIGFRSLEESWDKTLNGYRYLRTEILELSAVTIPANAEASITAVKSASQALAASGRRSATVQIDYQTNHPGATGQNKRGNMAKTIQEQVAGLEASRAAKVARKEALLDKSTEEGRTNDAAELEEIKTLESEIEAIDENLTTRRKHLEQIKTTPPVSDKGDESLQTVRRMPTSIIPVKGLKQPEPGAAFVRLAMAIMAAKGDRGEAYDQVRAQKAWKDTTPQVEQFLANSNAMRIAKAAVEPGDTTTAGWAAELADYTWMASEFIEYLRPQTIIGKFGANGITALRRVPFNIKVPTQTAGGSVNWVGEGLAKPVTKITLSTATLRFAKVAGIVVMTEELVRFSNPAAEGLVRDDLAAAIIQFLDEQFVDPTIAAVANVSPASITNGAGNMAASGTTADDFRNDLRMAITQMINANINPAGVVLIMQSSMALALSLMRNDLGNKEFPDLTAAGGTVDGLSVITSQSVPVGVLVFVQPREIMLADDGVVGLDVSREATVTMDDGVSPYSTTQVSLWQNNLVGLRVERVIDWRRRRDAAVFYITAAGYGGASPS